MTLSYSPDVRYPAPRTYARRAHGEQRAQAPGAQLGALLHQPVRAAALDRAARGHHLPARAPPRHLREGLQQLNPKALEA